MVGKNGHIGIDSSGNGNVTTTKEADGNDVDTRTIVDSGSSIYQSGNGMQWFVNGLTLASVTPCGALVLANFLERFESLSWIKGCGEWLVGSENFSRIVRYVISSIGDVTVLTQFTWVPLSNPIWRLWIQGGSCVLCNVVQAMDLFKFHMFDSAVDWCGDKVWKFSRSVTIHKGRPNQNGEGEYNWVQDECEIAEVTWSEKEENKAGMVLLLF